ncbi:MAG: hypothetical protein LZF60_10066 [Nitrospira sp.]|nr:hypothetical protein [Nitrospira sp.]ULA57947.1 MAG: hypothetical protein LZF60_10066 [Nitrospira sp.]
MIRQHVVRGISAPVAVGLLLLMGCSGKGDIIPMTLTPKAKEMPNTSSAVKPMAGPKVVVIPFEDARADHAKVGSRSSMWGGETDFHVSSGNAGEETGQAFADYLKRKGWLVQYQKAAPPESDNGPNIVLSGKILDLAVDAKRGFFMTDIEARSKLVIQANNREDGSSIVRTDAHSGSHDNVFWFDPQDGEELLAEVLEKNFERFVLNTKLEDRSLRFR